MKRTRNPRFVKQYRDAAGTWINQYRRRGRLIRLPNGRDFNETWWKAYYAAEAEILSGDTLLPAAAARVKVNSIDAALIGYYRSTTFRNLALNTQRNFRHLLERDVRLPIGDLPLAKLGPRNVMDIIAGKVEQTSAGSARMLLGAIRNFIAYAIEAELIDRDPTAGTKAPVVTSEGHHTWTEEQIAQFLAHWPEGSQPRLALGLHLYTAQRRSDTIRMGWQHLQRGSIRLVQKKTKVEVAIPVHPELQRMLDLLPRTNLAFLLTDGDLPYKEKYYGHRFRQWTDAAGLPRECTSHGLRKAAIVRLIEAGCTVSEAAAISGHKTLSEIQRYAEKVNKDRLSEAAMAKVVALGGSKP